MNALPVWLGEMGSAPDTFEARYLEKKRRACWCCACVCDAYLAEGAAAAVSAPHCLENGERPAPLFCAGGIPARHLCGPHRPGSGVGDNGELINGVDVPPDSAKKPKPPNPDWRYSASLRAGMQGAVHMEETGGLRVGSGGPEQQWPTVSSATTEPEAGEVSPPVGAGVNSNSWTFKYGPGNSKQPGPSELPDKFIIPGSPAIISIRQDPPNSQTDKSDFITFGKKEETKKKKKKKKGNKDKKEKTNCTTDNSDQ